jgi:hypothetical protein
MKKGFKDSLLVVLRRQHLIDVYNHCMICRNHHMNKSIHERAILLINLFISIFLYGVDIRIWKDPVLGTGDTTA